VSPKGVVTCVGRACRGGAWRAVGAVGSVGAVGAVGVVGSVGAIAQERISPGVWWVECTRACAQSFSGLFVGAA